MANAIPFFSVIITTYNRAPLVGRALQSLITQTISDWEGIILDDGSTDNTKEIVAQYLPRHPGLQYYHRKPQGATWAKNEAMSLSKGKYIAFLDSDDEYAADYLEERKTFLQTHSNVDFLHGGVHVIGDPFLPDMDHPGKKIHISQCAVGGTFIISRSLYQNIGGFTEMPLGSDSDYLNRIQKVGYEIATITHPGYIYHRETANSITNNLLRHGWDAAKPEI